MPDLPKRKPIRLKNYDYSSAGAYFITICTKERKKLLSEICVGTVGDVGPYTLYDCKIYFYLQKILQ